MKIQAKTRIVILSTLFISFAAYSVPLMWEVGYLGIWQGGFASAASFQILWDLVIACTLICSWIVGDAKANGRNPYPWVIGTLLTGTFAPLAYLIYREVQKTETTELAQGA